MATASPVEALRKSAGLTQVELAERLGVSQPAVAQMEARGEAIELQTLRRVGSAIPEIRACPLCGGAPKRRKRRQA